MTQDSSDVVIVSAKRTAIGRAPKGALRNTRPDDLAATLYHLMGINPESEVIDRNNRPLAISGKPVLDVIA